MAKIKRSCKNCENIFYIKKYIVLQGYGKFCCKKCYTEYIHKNMDIVMCHGCNLQLLKCKSDKNRSNYHFCSNTCKFKWQHTNPPRPRTGTMKECEWCNLSFYAQKKETKRFCSPMCGNLHKASLGLCGSKFYKTGYYTSKLSGKSEYYASSYELIRMNQLDELGIMWTKRHKIAIPYNDDEGKLRHYIPDFLIGDTLIEEVKPMKSIQKNYKNAYTKIVAAEKFCKINGYKFKVITEKELKIK